MLGRDLAILEGKEKDESSVGLVLVVVVACGESWVD